MWSRSKRGGPRPLRRSSTSRNIGNAVSSNGDHTNGDHDDDEDGSYYDIRRANSVGLLDEEAIKQKAEMDQHVANYVSDQLKRMRSNDSGSAYAIDDEIEAKYDGTSEYSVQSP